jgi:hypothetical protein
VTFLGVSFLFWDLCLFLNVTYFSPLTH